MYFNNDELASISQIENKINYFKINIKKNLISKFFKLCKQFNIPESLTIIKFLYQTLSLSKIHFSVRK